MNYDKFFTIIFCLDNWKVVLPYFFDDDDDDKNDDNLTITIIDY